MSELFDDSLRFAVKNFDGLRGKTYGRSHLGSAVHFGTAFFDRERVIEGGRPDAAGAVAKFLEYFHNDEGIHWLDIRKSEAEKLGIRLVADYCTEVSPQFEFAAIEVTCEPFEITMPNGIIFELTGTDDAVYTRNGEYGIVDKKSGYGVIDQAGEVAVDVHGPQLACYELLETVATRATAFPITLPAIVIAFSTRTAEIKWREIENPRSLLFGDAEHMGYLEAASKIIEVGIFVGNPRSMLCTPRYCPLYESCFYRLGKG